MLVVAFAAKEEVEFNIATRPCKQIIITIHTIALQLGPRITDKKVILICIKNASAGVLGLTRRAFCYKKTCAVDRQVHRATRTTD